MGDRSSNSLYIAADALFFVGCRTLPDSSPAEAEREADSLSPRECFELFSAKGEEQTTEELLTRRHVPGVNVAVIQDYKIAWARGYNGRGEAMNAKWHVYPELQAAGLWTTPTDLCRFAVELMNALNGKSDAV